MVLVLFIHIRLIIYAQIHGRKAQTGLVFWASKTTREELWLCFSESRDTFRGLDAAI
jgi:hypothetical protein